MGGKGLLENMGSIGSPYGAGRPVVPSVGIAVITGRILPDGSVGLPVPHCTEESRETGSPEAMHSAGGVLPAGRTLSAGVCDFRRHRRLSNRDCMLP